MRKPEDTENDKYKGHPIMIKAYKHNKSFNPKVSSTCPSLPRYHVTFGRPRLYEDVSKQIEKNEININASKEAR